MHTLRNGIDRNKLRPRNPSLISAKEDVFSITYCSREKYPEKASPLAYNPSGLLHRSPGVDLPLKAWTTFIRIRTSHERYADSHIKRDRPPSPECDCGGENQAVRYIVTECSWSAYTDQTTNFLDATHSIIKYNTNLNVSF